VEPEKHARKGNIQITVAQPRSNKKKKGWLVERKKKKLMRPEVRVIRFPTKTSTAGDLETISMTPECSHESKRKVGPPVDYHLFLFREECSAKKARRDGLALHGTEDLSRPFHGEKKKRAILLKRKTGRGKRAFISELEGVACRKALLTWQGAMLKWSRRREDSVAALPHRSGCWIRRGEPPTGEGGENRS